MYLYRDFSEVKCCFTLDMTNQDKKEKTKERKTVRKKIHVNAKRKLSDPLKQKVSQDN